MTRAYYNEFDPAAAAVLRELVLRDVIPAGEVDTRSIKEVTADDIRGYTSCHFFAGGGLWPLAGRLAGWPDARPWWTGSCPCQGESLAGKRLGADDPRHLWPDFYRLIRATRPSVIMGEQVAAAAGTHWLDGVCSDLAGENYAARAVDIPACAVDAPHQRNRIYWLAVDDRDDARLERQRWHGYGGQGWPYSAGSATSPDGELLGDAARIGWREGWPEHELRSGRDTVASADVCLQPQSDSGRETGRSIFGPDQSSSQDSERPHNQSGRPDGRNGSWWADAEWIVSPLDGKARRTKPGLPFLVDGLPGRVDLWRVGGNAISPILAAEVIAAFRESEAEGLMLSSQSGNTP